MNCIRKGKLARTVILWWACSGMDLQRILKKVWNCFWILWAAAIMRTVRPFYGSLTSICRIMTCPGLTMVHLWLTALQSGISGGTVASGICWTSQVCMTFWRRYGMCWSGRRRLKSQSILLIILICNSAAHIPQAPLRLRLWTSKPWKPQNRFLKTCAGWLTAF